MMMAAYTGGNRPGATCPQGNGEKVYIIKGDLSGYFMSMKRQVLYDKVVEGLNKQFPNGGWLYKVTKYLWREVIFDDPCLNARLAGSLKDWDCLPYSKSLFHQPDDQGIVIGNLTSQLLSNILLNDFDWFMKRDLGFTWYGRYVDDFFVIVPEREYERALAMMKNEVPKYLGTMGLKIHPKKLYVQEAKKGCPFLGKKVKPNVILPGKRYIKNMRQAMIGYVEGAVSYETMQSYIGMAKHMAAYSELRKIVDSIKSRQSFEDTQSSLGNGKES